MEDGDESKDVAFYEQLSAKPVAPPRTLKVKEQARKFEEAAQMAGAPAIPSTPPSKSITDDTYGLKILGCKAPGIGDRPLSASTRLGPITEANGQKKCSTAAWMTQNMLSTTDEFGDVMEVSDTFQKLKISRNNHQAGPCDGAGEGPLPMMMPAFLTPEEKLANATNGVTIQSLTSNTVVVVPETHRSCQCSSSRAGRPSTAVSSGEEIQIHPTAVHKSKIHHSRRRRTKRTEPAKDGTTVKPSKSFHRSLPDESKKVEGEGEVEVVVSHKVANYDSDSDVGADLDRDYGTAPPTAGSTISTKFNPFELIRPETTSSEILAEGAVASEEDGQLKRLMSVLEIRDDENWYSPVNEETDESTKNKLLQLTKLFYQRITKSAIQGCLYTFKLILGGLHNRLEDFVLLSVPPGFVVKTRVTRVKRGVAGRLYPVYYMHLEREGPGDRKCLLLVAKKCQSFRGIGYVLSTDPAELSEKSEYCVGKISSNFIGTEFTLYGGRSICTHVPLDKGALQALPKVERFKEELATVIYDPNVLGFKGPRKIKTLIPRMKNILEREVIRPRISEESLINQYQNEEMENIWCLRNKDPIWNRETHSYILNFGGRVSTASVKNFQIICNNEKNDQILLQFGRASKNTFSLDFQFPFCPLQAFAIALTSFDSKLACE